MLGAFSMLGAIEGVDDAIKSVVGGLPLESASTTPGLAAKLAGGSALGGG